jgi:hypothetical protein
MKEQLINLLSTFGYPVRQQGTLGPTEKYPDSFFTFWNDETDDGSHYDNDPISFVWQFTVYFYSKSPVLVNEIMLSVRDLLRSNGWIIGGVGYDVRSDEESHTGRAINVYYVQRS